MSIRFRSDDYLNAAPHVVARTARRIFARHRCYHDTQEMQRDTVFETQVHGRWLPRIRLNVVLAPSTCGTQVVVRANSSWFVIGGMLKLEDRAARAFLRELRLEYQRRRELRQFVSVRRQVSVA
jgi:hypothetical protein